MEIWKDVIGYEEYFKVSNLGRIYSKRSSKILAQVISKSGYSTVPTRIGGRKGLAICMRVHRVVAEAFLENPHKKPQVNHIDGIKSNNCLTNLEWVTEKENVRHAFDTGLNVAKKGSERSNSKLTEEAVRYCRENYKPRCKEHGLMALSRKFGVDKRRIYDAIHYLKWAHVD